MSLPWALLAVLFGTIILALLAYAARPTVGVKIGSRYDTPFLSNMHDREFGAVAPQADFAWPRGNSTIELATGLSPAFEMATLTLDPFTPTGEFRRRLVSVYANGDEIANFEDLGGASREFRTLLPTGATSSGRMTLRAITIPDTNSTALPPLQVEKVQLSAASTYRWTTERSTISFPALGKGDWQVTLQAIVDHPDNKPVAAKLYANDILVANLPDYAGPRTLSALIPAAVIGDGDLTLRVEATPFNDPRPLGVLIERVTLAPAGGWSLATVLPPLSVVLPLIVIALALYGSLRRVQARPLLAAGGALVVMAVGAWALIAFRYPIAFYLRPLTLVMLLGLALALLADWLMRWLCRSVGLPLAPGLRSALVLIFLVSFWLKAGGLVFPYMQAIDIQWHMEWVRRILAGDLPLSQLYGTRSPLNDLTMPIAEWGANRPIIPYSPFFQIFALSFSIFPWKLEHTANVLSAAVDSSRVFLIALLALKAGLPSRTTLLAALLYAVTPVTFLLHAWGNVPTTLAMWLTLLATTIIVVGWERLQRPWPFTLLTLVTLACMLLYTVMAAFHLIFIALFGLFGWLMRKQFDTRPLRPVLLATALAFGLAVLVYYGQYILPVLTTTVPYLLAVFTRGPQSVGVTRPPFSAYILDFGPHLVYWFWPGRYLYYGLVLPLIAVIPGFVLLRSRQPLWAALAAWFSVAVLFMFVGYRISMVDKQLFYILPPICLCAAVAADWLWRKLRWTRWLIGLAYVATFASALALWIVRIQRSPFG